MTVIVIDDSPTRRLALSQWLLALGHGVRCYDSVREVLDGVEGVGILRFTDADVVRHPLVSRIVRAYEERGGPSAAGNDHARKS